MPSGQVHFTLPFIQHTPEVYQLLAMASSYVSLAFFTSNAITPDIPLEKILTFWQTDPQRAHLRNQPSFTWERS
jgi:hypothetical protein